MLQAKSSPTRSRAFERALHTSLLLPLIGLLVVAPCGAQPAVWDEDQAVAQFVDRSPPVAMVREQVQGARADVVGASLRPNPVLDLSREQVFSGGGPTEEHRLGLQIPLTLPGKRDLRIAVAQSGVTVAEARAHEQILALTHGFRSVYGDAFAAAARAQALDEDLSRLRRIERVIEARAKAGESAGYDLIRVRLARSAAEARLSDVRAEADRQRARLAGMAGQAPVGALKLATPGSLPRDEDLVAIAMDRRADVRTVRSERARAEQALDLARRGRWPDPSVSLGVTQTNEPTVQGLGYLVGLGWPLPVFDQNLGEAARAGAERDRLVRQEAALVARIRSEVPAARRALEARLDALTRFERDALARVADMTRIAAAAYSEGDQGIVSLLDAHQAALNTRLQAIDLTLSVHSAQLDLEREVGTALASL